MAGYGSYDDHLNKPLPIPMSASPAPMDAHDNRQPTLPFRHDTVVSNGAASSVYSQRGNTLPPESSYPPRQDTYTSAATRQDTFASAVSRQPTGYSSAYGAPASEPPSYTSNQHLGTQYPPAAQHNISPVSSANANPFDTPFDDHAASSRQNLTGMASGSNDIPLQDRAVKSPTDEPDHVYEAPRKRSKKQGVRFGELGMFGAYGNRIPWVVYIFTVVQIGVFIGELIDNCMFIVAPFVVGPRQKKR